MNEFGETPTVYLWPKGHVEGEPYPDDFWEKVQKGLKSVGIEYETT